MEGNGEERCVSEAYVCVCARAHCVCWSKSGCVTSKIMIGYDNIKSSDGWVIRKLIRYTETKSNRNEDILT